MLRKNFQRINILDATEVVTDMLDKVYELNQSSYVTLKSELIDPSDKIVTIVENCRQQYAVNDLDVQLGETYPVRGEKTLLH